MNDTYLRLGRIIARRCPVGFETARLVAEIDEGRIGMRITCNAEGGPDADIDPTPVAEELIDCLRLVRETMAEDGSDPWRKCTVTLRKGGHFSLDVE